VTALCAISGFSAIMQLTLLLSCPRSDCVIPDTSQESESLVICDACILESNLNLNSIVFCCAVGSVWRSQPFTAFETFHNFFITATNSSVRDISKACSGIYTRAISMHPSSDYALSFLIPKGEITRIYCVIYRSMKQKKIIEIDTDTKDHNH